MITKFKDILYVKGRIGWQALKKEEYLTEGDYYLVTGINIKDDYSIDYKSCYYVSKERYEKDEAIQLKDGDIILTKDGTIGKIGVISNLDKPATLNSHLFLIRNLRPDILNTKYLFYLLQSDKFVKYSTNNTYGSNIPAFTQKSFTEYETELPSLIEQERIAYILDSLDTQIKRNNSMVQKLQVLALTIYSRWFIQFKHPNSTNKLIFNDELKKEIPENWNVKKLAEICNILLGGTPKTEMKEYWGGNIHWLNSGEIANFPVVTSGLNITELGLNNSSTKLMKAGTTLVSITGNIRASFLVIDSCANQSVIGIEENELFKVNFLYPFINNLVDYYEKSSTGNCQKHINKGAIENSYVLVPPFDILVKYNQYTENIYKQISNISLQNRKLINLKNKILPLLINQQLI